VIFGFFRFCLEISEKKVADLAFLWFLDFSAFALKYRENISLILHFCDFWIFPLLPWNIGKIFRWFFCWFYVLPHINWILLYGVVHKMNFRSYKLSH
jgi:hypothetical protein